MPSPFPGMDPYLESHWPDVHASMAMFARGQLRRQMPPGLKVRVEEYMSVEEEEKDQRFAPDVRIHDEGHGYPPKTMGGVTAATPIVVEIEPTILRSVRVVDTRSNNRIVTVIEFVSPANKEGQKARQHYLDRRTALLHGGANFVEVDFIRRGGNLLPIANEDAPAGCLWPYRVCVIRNAGSMKAEFYQATFRERLPIINVPLREQDADAQLDLQDLIDRGYDEGQYDDTFDYGVDPPPPFRADDLAWIDGHLRQLGRR